MSFKDKIKERHRDGFWSQGDTPEIKEKTSSTTIPVPATDEALREMYPRASKPRVQWKRTGPKTPAEQLDKIKELTDLGLMSEEAARRLIQEVLHPTAATSLEDIENLARNFRLPEGHHDPFVKLQASEDGFGRIRVVGEVSHYFGWGIDRLKRELTDYLAENIPAGLRLTVELTRNRF